MLKRDSKEIDKINIKTKITIIREGFIHEDQETHQAYQ